MKNNIIYTLCSYLPEDANLVKKMAPNIKGMGIWAKTKNADFKVVTKIPTEIENIFKNIPNQEKLIKRKPKWIHSHKAWCTKISIFHDFYHSPYEKMLYLDCDLIPYNYKINRFNFNDYENVFHSIIKNKVFHKKDYPIQIAQKLLDKENKNITIEKRIGADIFLLTKNFKHNISNVFNYDALFNACSQHHGCLREEVFMTYILNKTNIINDMMHVPKTLTHIRGVDVLEKKQFKNIIQWKNL